MHLDVQELRDFYYGTTLGPAVQQCLRERILGFWPKTEVKGQTIVGYGFAAPVLRPYLTSARRIVSLMPGPQGAMHWPAGQPNMSVLIDEAFWPIETNSADRLIVLHGLDASDHPGAVLEECYRVLSNDGRAIFVVPNRASLWSRRSGTPFSLSQPYSMGQLEKRLKWHGFDPVHHATALYQPPSDKRFWMKTGPIMEQVWQKIPAWNGGGALLVEVIKKVPRPQRPGLGQIVQRNLPGFEPVVQPERSSQNM